MERKAPGGIPITRLRIVSKESDSGTGVKEAKPRGARGGRDVATTEGFTRACGGMSARGGPRVAAAYDKGQGVRIHVGKGNRVRRRPEMVQAKR